MEILTLGIIIKIIAVGFIIGFLFHPMSVIKIIGFVLTIALYPFYLVGIWAGKKAIQEGDSEEK